MVRRGQELEQGPERVGGGAEAALQLLRRAARPPHLHHRLWQRPGVHGSVQGESPADHHQLPDRQPGRGRPAGGHALHALGGVPGGKGSERLRGVRTFLVGWIGVDRKVSVLV